MANQRTPSQHCNVLAADTIEAYVLGSLPSQRNGSDDDPEVQAIEEHLLWCESCQTQVQAEEKTLSLLRAALTSFTKAKKPLKVMTAGR